MSEKMPIYPPCKKCDNIVSLRRRVVLGEGDPKSKIMFIGEAPGNREDKEGRPFVGAAGKVFESLLTDCNVSRAQVYVTNIVKCRPSTPDRKKNRQPTITEVKNCIPYLTMEREQIKPKVISPMGNIALVYFLPETTISKVHGQLFPSGEYSIIPLYHPAVAVYDPNFYPILLKDMEFALSSIGR